MGLVLAMAVIQPIWAQLVAGGYEDKLYQQIENEKNADKKIQLLLTFEKTYPKSSALVDVDVNLMGLYQQKNDSAKTIEYGEKAIKLDGENIAALVAVAREYAVQKKNLDRALAYAQKAVDTVVKMKSQPVPGSYSPAQWKQYIDSTESTARGILAYVKSVG